MFHHPVLPPVFYELVEARQVWLRERERQVVFMPIGVAAGMVGQKFLDNVMVHCKDAWN